MDYSVKISVIIPAYNADKFLQRALNSVYAQSLKELEIIIVNDASIDNTPNIAIAHQKQDSRITILNHKHNQGLAAARNTALQHVHGKYLFFLDADDEIVNKHALEILYNKAEKNQLELLIFDYYKIYANQSKTHKKLKIPPNTLLTTIDSKKQLLKAGVVVWNKLYLSDFVLKNKIIFPEGILFEDIPFTWQVLTQATKIWYLKQEFYAYWQNEHSLMNSYFSDDKIHDIVKSMQVIYQYLLTNNFYDHYKSIYEPKLLTTFTFFFKKSQGKSFQLFVTMADALAMVNLADYKKSFSIYKYYKYKCFIEKKFIIYKLFFQWI